MSTVSCKLHLTADMQRREYQCRRELGQSDCPLTVELYRPTDAPRRIIRHKRSLPIISYNSGIICRPMRCKLRRVWLSIGPTLCGLLAAL